ncbi:hypothetical protein BHM03_00025807 [Ensete ventricosum]|nr:hypothetical protein BHM03_00025807 [Ensete ventricosum]
MQLLESCLKVKEYELLMRNLSETGCFEHIDLGIKYDTEYSFQDRWIVNFYFVKYFYYFSSFD